MSMANSRTILKSPKYYPTVPDWSGNVYMPVSMNNRLIRDSVALSEILGWIFEHADSCDAIIGDYLHRHNIMMDGTDEAKSITLSKKLGDGLVELLQSKMKDFPGKVLNIRPVKEFYERLDVFNSKLNYYLGLYDNNAVFHEEIQFLIHQFLERQGHIDGSPKQIELCKLYILEELVVFEMLAEEGCNINIYPGKQLRVFKKIVTRELRQISKDLEKVSLVELRVKPAFAAKLVTQNQKKTL